MPLIRRFPWIADLPLEALHKEGTTKVVISRLARGLMAHGEPDGKDLLSRILRGGRESPTGEKLSQSQVVDNVRAY